LAGLYQAASENFGLKAKLFASMAKEMRPDAILASNTSSISITKIAATTIPEGQGASSEAGRATTSRVVGMFCNFTAGERVNY